jgi:serine/threonine protein kinase
LQSLLHGELDPTKSDELTAHLGDCPGCQEVMEAVASGEVRSLPAAVRHLPMFEPPAAVWRAIDRVVVEVTRTGAYQTLPKPNLDDDLAFLTPTTTPGRIGTFGHFEIVRMIGRGGMGVVLHAFDPDLQRDVALKVLDPDLSTNKVARQRFCREARAAGSVTHENIVTVHLVNEDGRSGLPYLVMQLINGESLEQRLRRVGKLDVTAAARLGAQAAAGLAAAHAQGLIHRDIKPGNILIEAGDRVKLTDFGLARAAEDLKLTRTGYVSGTPLYMAPEQARGDEVDARADLFSLGVVLYEVVAGKPPFDGKTPLAVLREVADTPHRPLRKVVPDVPEWFEDVVDGLLAKSAEDRLDSAAEVAAVLGAHTSNLNGVCDDTPASPCAISPAASLSKIAKRKYRRKLLAIMAAPFALGLTLGGFGSWAVFGGSKPPVEVPGEPVIVAAAGETQLDNPAKEFKGGSGAIWSVAACPDKKTLALGSEDGTLKLYDLTDGALKHSPTKHKGPIWGIDYHPTDDTQFVTASGDGTVKLWKLNNNSLTDQDVFRGASGVRAVAYSPDGLFLAIGEWNGRVSVFHVAELGKPLEVEKKPFVVYEHGSSLTGLVFSPTGCGGEFVIATAGSDKTAKLWRGNQTDQFATLNGHFGPVYAVAFDKDGKQVATAGWDKTIRLWNADDGTPKDVTMSTIDGGTWSLAFTPCCGYLAAAGQDGTVRIFNTATGTQDGVMRGHRQAVHVVKFTREVVGQPPHVISGGRDGAVRLWDLKKK